MNTRSIFLNDSHVWECKAREMNTLCIQQPEHSDLTRQNTRNEHSKYFTAKDDQVWEGTSQEKQSTARDDHVWEDKVQEVTLFFFLIKLVSILF